MKIKDGFVLRTLCGETIVVGEGLAQINFNKMLSLNKTAAWLWEQVQGREFTADDMVNALTEHYEVSEETARKDVEKLLQTWKEQGVVE